ncbi:MAG TPA: TldD/PmbA family protein [Candidatus Binatia bacterium]|nr:TldD/PmbA family protein [Candidatus Binatia bacterium]
MWAEVERRFREVAPAVDFCSLRLVEERDEHLSVRRGVAQPPVTSFDVGGMITVVDGDGMGYGATSDLTLSGLRRAVERAHGWARETRGRGLVDASRLERMPRRGEYATTVREPWSASPLGDKIELLQACSRRLQRPRIEDWEAGLWYVEKQTLLLSADGGRLEQRFSHLLPTLSASANEGAETQTRTFGGHAYCRQGGLEVLDETGFHDAPEQIAAEAVELLAAPNCPSGTMDLVLAPDQMILQIHESIGHPLELDRILGDERNYAGRSFVTLDMFGRYRYGSEALNVSFDPQRAGELASYAFDDEGQPATRQDIIRGGILLRPLGGRVSQARAGIAGVANSRASSWNRPPIDRMANLNLEPGASTLDELFGAVDRGVYMKTNCSWSIDDSRNKFQFGCEWGRLIEGGRLTRVVKNPNYRGISATFWRGLRAVGRPDTVDVLGTPYCGKGEPNQAIAVGHASPPCLFSAVDVFGGA